MQKQRRTYTAMLGLLVLIALSSLNFGCVVDEEGNQTGQSRGQELRDACLDQCIDNYADCVVQEGAERDSCREECLNRTELEVEDFNVCVDEVVTCGERLACIQTHFDLYLLRSTCQWYCYDPPASLTVASYCDSYCQQQERVVVETFVQCVDESTDSAASTCYEEFMQ